jgi:HPt (histidine-containing phosphotransfer) domain-containing protein
MIRTFGSAEVVEQMLGRLLLEARKDCAGLAHARITDNTQVTLELLHRLLGSLAFLGCDDLEAQGGLLIQQVRAHGAGVNRDRLEAFEADIERYFAYLSAL